MIALCLDHAARADSGAFTPEQLRAFKRDGRKHSAAIEGRFEWMRQDLLAVVGGGFYYETPIIFQLGDHPCIWFKRDPHRYLMLNFWMPTVTAEGRARVIDNDWIVPPTAADIECPVSGRRLKVKYPNGDHVKFEFFDIQDRQALTARYPDANMSGWLDRIALPSTGVEISERAANTPIEFGPRETKGPGVTIRGYFVGHSQVGIHLRMPTGVSAGPAEPG
jgi:hypothetical protein